MSGGQFGKNTASKAKHQIPENIIFSAYTSDEIRKLSVLKIQTPLTFDALGHPFDGGLYDRRLAPIFEDDLCATCFKYIDACPGHFSYIDLPLPVINPIFFEVIFKILKCVCLACYKPLIPKDVVESVKIQTKLLNCGLPCDAIDASRKIKELVSLYKNFDGIPEGELEFLKEYENRIESLIEENVEFSGSRNTEYFKNQLEMVFQKTWGKLEKKCKLCKAARDRLSKISGKIILSKRGPKDKNSEAGNSRILDPNELKRIFRLIWENGQETFKQVVPLLNNVNSEYPTDVFFFDVVPVVPPICRPLFIAKGKIMEHPIIQPYKAIVRGSILLRAIMQVFNNQGNPEVLSKEAQNVYALSEGSNELEKLMNAWNDLQSRVNDLWDHKNISDKERPMGIKQLIEKKHGLIRKNLMGKRVNYAARSVITPDPNLNINEIGIPEVFAKRLTYPVPVTTWNVEEMRKLVENGPKVHPGAVMVQFENGYTQRITDDKKDAVLKRLLTNDGHEDGFKGVKTIYRHLCNGDILLMNRQPTLHRPSLMAHTARILKGEKTVRMHYANCKAYNADFDGDEMNIHFPQNELGRSEGYNIANVSSQYLVPKDGTPLSGLIQDHMIAGVRMSIRGKFFNKHDYQQLVYQALSFKNTNIILLPPSILKPKVLWSGKQILSTVILNVIPRGRDPITLLSTAKIPAKTWVTGKKRKWKCGKEFKNENCMSEAEVIINHGELLVGILDKMHYGATPYGLIHCMHELYGGDYAIKLLSAFAKLFTVFLQREGFTLGVHDILVLAAADKLRTDIVKNSRVIGKDVMAEALSMPKDSTLEELVEKVEEQTAHNPKITATIDRQYKSALDSFTNDINKVCLPVGLVAKFPENNLQLMVLSGAKGSTVNTMQISCLLGQIELEGKRPPKMVSGKSLPSFPIFEFAPRAGGFIDGRFMTGIQPQEFFFHCMAGREGLIDTAVKTSRSGYLQRCLIKHLEGINIAYDLTVRDSDKSVIQFAYGEDSMDLAKVQFFKKAQMDFLIQNWKSIAQGDCLNKVRATEQEILKHKKKLKKWKMRERSAFSLFSQKVASKVDKGVKVDPNTGRDANSAFIEELWRETDEETKKKLAKECKRRPDPLVSKYSPDTHFGSINEKLAELIEKYEKSQESRPEIVDMLKLKAMQSVCVPGEPVGILAAQSIGEPSTQMTLNTFHFAGRGEMNVTLGIPRMREILMVASKNIKTPCMEVPFLDVPRADKKAKKLCKLLTRVVASDVLEKIDVTQELELYPNRYYKTKIRFQFIPYELYKDRYHLKPESVLKKMTTKYFREFFVTISRKAEKVDPNMVGADGDSQKKKKKKVTEDGEDEEEEEEEETGEGQDAENEEGNLSDSSEDEEPEDAEDAKTNAKYAARRIDEEEDEEEEIEESVEHVEIIDLEDADEEQIKLARTDVLNRFKNALDYSFDTKELKWCELTFSLPLAYKKVDLITSLKEVSGKLVLWETPGIKRAITYTVNNRLTLRTDGINMVEIFKHDRILDVNRLYSNDIHRIAETYGIEAAMKVIVKEVRDVFKVYGITVDPRHLSLVADYMTYRGCVEPLSRVGMQNNASPLHQMSFESSVSFLRKAIIKAKNDHLENPSSCLMLGKPCLTGTGSFNLLQRMDIPPVALA